MLNERMVRALGADGYASIESHLTNGQVREHMLLLDDRDRSRI